MEMTSSSPKTHATPLGAGANYLAERNAGDWLFAFVVVFGAGIAYLRFGKFMDVYDIVIFFLHVPLLIALGSAWRPFRLFVLAVTLLSLMSIWLYQGNLARAEQGFLKYFSSQATISWMSILFFVATFAYWLGFTIRSEPAERTGSAMTWIAAVMGTVGLLVRWHESYLVDPDTGHIPVSSMYEVLVFFSLVTALLYLFYESRYNTRKLGAFVLPVISAAVLFLLWFSFTRGAYQIQPLVPALQSYWMKIHVPANFIGYGGFAIAAMVGIAYLIVLGKSTPSSPLPGQHEPEAGNASPATYSDIRPLPGQNEQEASEGTLSNRLPEPRLLEDVMYRAIAIGFAFFTIATIFGSLWAAESWGRYWSWDPKETWALIVWINYAVWLHMRLTRTLRGTILAWWAIVGLFVVTFAFVGVNMFLSGLHSYGSI
jgi:cytochrome c-type biogenesis protein CcsB